MFKYHFDEELFQQGFERAIRQIIEQMTQNLDDIRQDDALTDEEKTELRKAQIEDTSKQLEASMAKVLSVQPASDIDWTWLFLDKVNTTIWNAAIWKDKDGHSVRDIGIHTEPEGQDPTIIPFTASFDFEKLEEKLEKKGMKIKLSKELNSIDKQYFTAIASLYTQYHDYRDGRSVFTLTDVCREAGYTAHSNALPLNEAKASLIKMLGTIITFDNQSEIDADYNYPKVTYTGSLLPLEIVEVDVNGIHTDGIHLLREPPLLEFARSRKQLTKIPLAMLESGPRKSEMPLMIRDYLLQRITHYQRDVAKKRKAFARLSQKKPESLTAEDVNRLSRLEEELSKPLFIKHATLLGKMPQPDVTLKPDEKKLPQEEQARILKKRQSQNARQLKKRVIEYAQRYLDDWAKNGYFIASYTTGNDGFRILLK